ncbi:MAG: hypothetical protein A2Y10_07270 [Planctomycetes bacterium GWF2_41_51]|nr:MAG: hypothetical protein A2Y10_07270 [Planctomycetes bacterium GWF2_41_51]HBG27884.1 hypothetical protein [Phycisphaerales bacterium]
MKRFLILIIALVCVYFYASDVQAELLKNPGFEDGDNPGYHGQDWNEFTWPEYWWEYGDTGEGVWSSWKSVWGGSPWAARNGDKLLGIGAWWNGKSRYVGQSVKVNSGEVLTFRVWAMTENWGNPIGGLMIEWKDETDFTIGTELYYDITSGVPLSYWDKKEISAVVVPEGAVQANIQMFGEYNGSVLFDDASVFFTYAANDEQPADGTFASPVTTTQLSWTRPAPRNGTDTIYCDVWFGTDPVMPGTNTKILSHTAADSVAISPVLNQTYYWRVDCYDPAGGSEIKTEGRVWSFNTGNSAPVVEAGKKQAVWLSGGTATVKLDSTSSDDDLPNPPAALTYSWMKLSGPGTVVFTPSNTVEDPNATFTVAGDYILKLTVSDSEKDSNDTVKIRVYNESYTGLIAQWRLDEASGVTAADNIGSHNGTLIGGPVWQPSGGYVDGALLFDGVDDYINCGGGVEDHNFPSWADLTEEITVSAWIKVDEFDSSKTWQAIISKGDTAWRLARAGDENVINFACNGLSPNFDVQGFTDVTDGQWHHIVGTYDGTEIAIYVDGILDIWTGSPAAATGSIEFDNNDVYIGSNSEEPNREFSGMIDQVRIYEIGLPADRIVELFREDGGKNSCGQNLTGDINGDCYVDFADFAEMAFNWLKCNDIGNLHCD